MSRMAIVVTFDLHDVKESPNIQKVYDAIKRDLAGIRINKFILRSSGKETSLPGNTFVGMFEERSSMKAKAVRSQVEKKVKEIIRSHHKKSTIFVFVGKDWAWSRNIK